MHHLCLFISKKAFDTHQGHIAQHLFPILGKNKDYSAPAYGYTAAYLAGKAEILALIIRTHIYFKLHLYPVNYQYYLNKFRAIRAICRICGLLL